MLTEHLSRYGVCWVFKGIQAKVSILTLKRHVIHLEYKITIALESHDHVDKYRGNLNYNNHNNYNNDCSNTDSYSNNW